MKKIVFVLALMLSCNTLNADKLIKASVAHKITKQETSKIKKELMNSKKGKNAYNGLIRLFNIKISKIASKGYYNSYIITFMNAPDKIGKLLKPLSDIEQHIVRNLVIKELKSKGYEIQYNKFWNNSGSFNITIIW